MKINYIFVGLVIFSFAAALIFYPFLPEQMATHWGISGEVNGYSSKLIGDFLFPILLLAIVFLLLFLPKIDPVKENILKIKKYYDGLILAICIFFLMIQSQVVLWNIGILINPIIIMSIAIALLFIYIGFVCIKVERNWTLGIRTPWTLSDDEIWKKTNELGGKLFIASGIISFLGIFASKFSFFMIIIPIIVSAIFLVIYSYVLYSKKLKK